MNSEKNSDRKRWSNSNAESNNGNTAVLRPPNARLRSFRTHSRPESFPNISWFSPAFLYDESRSVRSEHASIRKASAAETFQSQLEDAFHFEFQLSAIAEENSKHSIVINAPTLGGEGSESYLERQTEEEEGSEDESNYPGKVRLAIITCSLMLAAFVVALDTAIIATAIPKITSTFNSLPDVGWYGSSFLFTLASLQPTFGKIYTNFSIKRTFIIALLIFEAGSVVCAAAQNSKSLIIGRAVAGVGASAIFSGGMTIVGYTVPLARRPFYFALLTSMYGISSIAGPLLGGVFTDRLSWRWCFWINLPIGGLAILIALFAVKDPSRRGTGLSLWQKLLDTDIGGATLLICAVVCLLLALQWGGSTYAWSNPKVWGCLLAFGILIVVFGILQVWLGDKATFPPRILRQRSVAFSCAFMAAISMGFSTHQYYLPFYFQAVRGTSAEGSGLRMIPYLVSNALASLVVGATLTKFGYYTPFMYIGAPIFAVGSGLLSTLKVQSSTGTWAGYECLASIGAGACIQIPVIAVQVALSKQDMPIGTALVFFANALGSAIAISVVQNLFVNDLVKQLTHNVPQISPALIVAEGATSFRTVVPPTLLDGVLQAYDHAVTRALMLPVAVGAIAFAFSLGMEQKRVPGNVSLGGGG